MDDDRADSKLSKSAPFELPAKPNAEVLDDEDWYQSGCGAGAPVAARYFSAHSAALPAASANGM